MTILVIYFLKWYLNTSRKDFQMNSFGVIFLVILEALVLLGGYLAYRDDFLTARQMVNNKGFKDGLPFLAHAGMWGDFFLVSPLIAVIISKFAGQWSYIMIGSCFVVAYIISATMHKLYVTAKIPESHTYGGRLTGTGKVHLVYMAIAIAILLLFFFCTKEVSKVMALSTSIILAVHIAIGNHVLVGLFKPSWFSRFPHKEKSTMISIGISWVLIVVGYLFLVNK